MAVRDLVLNLFLKNNLTAGATSASRAITSLADAGVAARQQLLNLNDEVNIAARILRGPTRNAMQDVAAQMRDVAVAAQNMPSNRVRELGQQIQQLAPQMGEMTPTFNRIGLRVDAFADKLAKLEAAGKNTTNSMRQGFLKLADVTEAHSFAPEEKNLIKVRAHMEQLGTSTQILSSNQIAGLGQRMQQLAPQMGAASPAIQRISQQLLGMASSMKMAEHAAKTMDAAMQGSVMAKTPRVAKMLAITQSAAQGMLLSSSIARPNIMGLAMSLVFLQFSVVKVALAFTALGLAIFGAVGLIKGMIQGGAAAEQFATRLQYLTKSLNDARIMFQYSRIAAMKWGIPKEELQDAIETLGRAKILGTNTLDLIANIRAGTGDSMKSIATALESAVEGNFSALKKYGIPDVRPLNNFATVMEVLGERYKGAADKMGATSISLGERIKATFGTAIERLGESFNLGIKPLLELLYVFAEAILNTISGFVQTNEYAESFGEKLRDIQAAARRAIPYIQYMGRVIGVLLVGALQLFLRLIKPTIDALNAFARTLKRLWNDLMDFLQKVKQWVSELIPWWDKVTEGINWAAVIGAAILAAIATVRQWWPILTGLLGRAIKAGIPLLLWFAFEKPIRDMLVDAFGEDLGIRIADTIRDLIVAGSLGYFLLGPKGLILALAITIVFKLAGMVLPDTSELKLRLQKMTKEFEIDPFKQYLDMWKVGWATVVKFFGNMLKDTWSDITFWGRTLGAVVDEVGRRIGDFLGNAGEKLGTFFGRLGEKIYEVRSSLGEGIGKALGSAGETIGAFLSGAGEGIGLLFSNLGESIGGVLGQVGEGIGTALGTAGETIGGFLGGAGENIGNFFGNLGISIGDVLGQIGTDIGIALGNAGSSIGDFLGAAGQNIGDFFGDLGTSIGNVLGKIGEGIGTALGNAGTSIGTYLGAAGKNIGDHFGNLGKSLGDVLKQIGEGIGGAFANAGISIGNFLGSAGKNIGDFFGNIGDGLGKRLGDIIVQIRDTLGNAWASLGTIVENFRNGPGQAIKGFFDGLGAIIAGIVDAVGRLADAIRNLPVISGIVGGGSGGGDIPGAAEGGIVTRRTLAMVGEGGEPEAIIPFSKMGSLGGPTIIINAQGSQFLSRRGMNEFADSVFEAAARKLTGPRRLSLQTIS